MDWTGSNESPALPCVFGAKEDQAFRAVLTEADRILTGTGLEERLTAAQIAAYENFFRPVSSSAISTPCAWPCATTSCRSTGLSFRQLPQRPVDTPLFQWFTRTGCMDGIRPVSKSTLEHFEKLLPVGQALEMIHELIPHTKTYRY
ncbi:MAG: hypothetical protein PWQ29_949 [Verrucomicrobiota bacterium]|jgi:hypothetical protein|nr:hypothetical protein [Verrucomicrobiota bacterium]